MSWIFIEPVDVWLFRDGRPFSAGEEHTARSIFPPTPLTVQGLLRSIFLGHTDIDWYDFRLQRSEDARALGDQIGHLGYTKDGVTFPPALGKFSMAGPYLAHNTNGRIHRLLPLPADVVQSKGEVDQYHLLRPTQNAGFQSNWPDHAMSPLWPPCEVDVENPVQKWLSDKEFQNYLGGKPFATYDTKDLVTAEPRLGISVDPATGIARESLLYQAEFMRPRTDVGLLVSLDNCVALPEGINVTPFGGEARSAHYRIVPDDEVVASLKAAQASHRIKVVLLTPAYFGGGWKPASGEWSHFFNGTSVKLVSVALGQPQRIGGWDIARRQPKPMHTYVPAGSVYYFESATPISPSSTSFTETPLGETDWHRLGFGQIAVGTWEWM